MKKIFSFISPVLMVLLATGSVLLSYSMIVNRVHFVRVVSNSMSPEFHKGDTLVVRAIPSKELNVGQIAVLPSVKEPGVYYSHRIIEKMLIGDDVEVRTKGDANPLADDWNYVITSDLVPVYFWNLPTAKIPIFHVGKWFLYSLMSLLIILFGSLFSPNLFKLKRQEIKELS